MPRRSTPPVIGVTQAPDVRVDQLELATLEKLADQLVLEEALVEAASLREALAGSVRVERSHLRDLDLSGARLRALSLVDVSGERIDAANGDWSGGDLRRVFLEDARLTGLNLSEAHIDEVSFKGCKLDYVNFRHSTIEHALFERCVLRGADFQGAKLEAARFANCQLLETDFSRARMSAVDLRGSELELAGSVLALEGAIVDSLQLMGLARQIALEVGITVEDA